MELGRVVDEERTHASPNWDAGQALRRCGFALPALAANHTGRATTAITQIS